MTWDGNQERVGDVLVVVKYVQYITNNNEGVECGKVRAGV
jgi:hypothetical protein